MEESQQASETTSEKNVQDVASVSEDTRTSYSNRVAVSGFIVDVCSLEKSTLRPKKEQRSATTSRSSTTLFGISAREMECT